MEKSLKGTRTEQNLLKAFAGESQAKNRYEFFAKQAKKEGYEQIAAIFMETAREEQAHAKRFFKFLEGGELEIRASYPAGIIKDTRSNLSASAAGEHLEWETLYKEAEATAREEGFAEIADVFKEIAAVLENEKIIAKEEFLSNGITKYNEYNLIVIPTLNVSKPKYTVGLGDTVSSTTLAAEITLR